MKILSNKSARLNCVCNNNAGPEVHQAAITSPGVLTRCTKKASQSASI